jgi:hypothetical protein
VTLLFSVTLFSSAFLLFCIEPLVGKMLLPVAGGAPLVWSTCLVFFQATLLAGYVFTQLSVGRTSPRVRAIVYVVLFVAALAAMPIAATGALRGHPVLALLALLVSTVFPPFFVLSTLAPALQRWFVSTRATHAHDPYFLYAASNAGSLAALGLYPFAIEPWLGLSTQARVLRVAFALLGVLVVACALASRAEQTTHLPRTDIAWSRLLRWALLAAIPSAQLVAVTTYITTEVAPAPLLWTVPLAAYLASFVVVFARKPILSHTLFAKRLPFVAIAGLLLTFVGANRPAALVFTVHVLLLFAVAMACHGEIASDRPDASRLPDYYVWMSLGGVLGGAAAALGAPVVFKQPIEYPLCLILALAWLRATRSPPKWVYALLAASLVLAVLGQSSAITSRVDVMPSILVGAPLLVAFAASNHPRALMWTLGAMLAIQTTFADARQHVVHRERSFFGAFSVTRDAKGTSLMHGNTMHGYQLAKEPRTPTLYYTTSGPIGDVIQTMHDRDALHSAALVGLGTGTLATYARPGEQWRFFELDPAVAATARDARYFTFLSDAFPNGADVVVGDARIELGSDDGHYDLLVVDAFTSDSIPTHLLTREAFAMFRTKLAAGATVAWHVSNRHFDLQPALAALADDASWRILVRDDPNEDARVMHVPSQWVAMAATDAPLEALRGRGWSAVHRRDGFRVWTDQRASIVTVW